MHKWSRALVLSFACAAIVAGATSLFAGGAAPAPIAVPSDLADHFQTDGNCQKHLGTYFCKIKGSSIQWCGSLCEARAAGAYACNPCHGCSACEPL